MAKCEKRPSWFKVFLHQKPLFDSVPDEVVGKAVKAAMHYFDTREQLELEPLPMAVFCTIKPYIDESFADYDRDVKNGKKGGRPPKPSVTPVNPGLPIQTEAETDEMHKQMPEADAVTADEPPTTFRQSINYESIKNLYNSVCVSLPRCTVLSDARKKAIKARFASGYTMRDFETLFQKSEASDFLKGRNERNWTATFDWLIKDASMAKVLSGNYDNNKGAKQNGTTEGYSEQNKQYGTWI